jgi:hypothetical protein
VPLGAENTVMLIAVVASGVIIWLFCAFSTASIARTNGASYNAWLLAGFVGGPVALLIAYLYFRYAGERYRLARHSDGGRYNLPEIMQCPHCDQSVPSSFDKCQFCGAPLHRKGKR